MAEHECDISPRAHRPFVPQLPEGARLLILTGLPTSEESFTGKPGKGSSRRKLLQMLKRCRIDPDTVAIAPVLPCRPARKDVSTLRNAEVDAARVYVTGLVERVKPRLVLAMGEMAVNVLQGDWPVGLHRGDLTEAEHVPCSFISTYAPGYPLQEKGYWDKQRHIESDIRKAYAFAEADEFPMGLGEDYSVVLTVEDARAARDYILSRPRFSFDFETEGFNLWGDDEILTLQISTAPGEGFVFPFRGAWRRHETDWYPDWQEARGVWGFIKGDDEQPKRVLFTAKSWERHEKNPKAKLSVMKPAFRGPHPSNMMLGDVVCQTPEKHDKEGGTWERGHVCRGYLTDVLGGKPVQFTGPGQQHGKWVPRDYLKMVDIARDLLESDVPKVAQNGKFDVHAARYRWDIRVRKFTFDTILAHHLLNEEHPHDLEYLRATHTAMPRYNIELKKYVPSKRHSFALVPNEVLWFYGAADADCEFRLAEPLWEELLKDNPEDGPWLFENIAMPLQRTLTQIEETGILIDRARLDELAEAYRQKIAQLKRQLSVMCEVHNLTPPEKWSDGAQLRDWLFQKQYDKVLVKEKVRACAACKSTGQVLLRDHRGLRLKAEDGEWLESGIPCPECKGTGKRKLPAVTTPMRGLGVPRWLAVPTKKGDTESSGAKTRKAIVAWCNETVETRYVVDSKGRGEVKRGKKELTAGQRAKRAWIRELIESLGELKTCIQNKNLFLDGDDDKQVLGAKALLRYIRSDGRVHPSFNQLIETGRLSATEPNTQNISSTKDEKSAYHELGIRSMFVAPEGYDFSGYDYSSEEVRILAYLSQDRDLIAKLQTCLTCGENFEPTQADPERPFQLKPHLVANGHEAVDIHRYVGSRVYNKPEEDVTDNERTAVKRVTFGLAYGQGPKGLSELLGCTIAEAKELMDFYFRAFPKLARYQGIIFAMTERGLVVPNAMGRLRHTYGLLEMKRFVPQQDYRMVLNAKHRERLNFTIQSPAADFLSLDTIALADVWGVEDGDLSYAHNLAHDMLGFHPATYLRDLGVRTNNSMHDALYFENPTKVRDELDRVVLTVMERVPWEVVWWYLPVDAMHGTNWH